MKNMVEFSVGIPKEVDRSDFEDHIEAVLQALNGLTGIIDPDAGIDYEQQVLTFQMYVEGDDPDIVAKVVTGVRTAIHTAGGSTPGWDSMLQGMMRKGSYEVRRADEYV